MDPRTTGCPLINNVFVRLIIVRSSSYCCICQYVRHDLPTHEGLCFFIVAFFFSRYPSCHSYLPDFATRVSSRRYRHSKVTELKDT